MIRAPDAALSFWDYTVVCGQRRTCVLCCACTRVGPAPLVPGAGVDGLV